MNEAAPSRAVVDLGAYADNLAAIRRMLPNDCGLMPAVKADAYGHGAVPIAKRAVEWGAEILAVATTDEAVALREAGLDCQILLLLTPPEPDLPRIIEHHLRLMISDVKAAERVGELARRANKVVPIHCKIDTGMGRQGFAPETAVADLLHLTRISHIDVEAIATHFAVAEDETDPYTLNQIRQFRQVLKSLEREGVPYENVHAANSGAIVNFAAACAFDLVRPGLMTYGVWPTKTSPEPCPVRPVLRWETELVLVRELPAGAAIGYGCTYHTPARMRCAIAPVGYADGYRYALGNRGEVLVAGQRCPVRGRVSMDQIVVDVSDVPDASVGDAVTLIGTDGEETISATGLAERAGTIPYDILTGIGARVRRVYVN